MTKRDAEIATDERCLVAIITRYLFLAIPQLNEMPPSKHIEHTTIDETAPDFSSNGCVMALPNR